jgi:hypothetical protein
LATGCVISLSNTSGAFCPAGGGVSYVNYDLATRPLNVGDGPATFQFARSEGTPAVKTTSWSWTLVHANDAKPPALLPGRSSASPRMHRRFVPSESLTRSHMPWHHARIERPAAAT